MRSILLTALAGLVLLVAAATTTGSRRQRTLGVVLALASLLVAWLLPPEPARVRGVLALVTSVCTMRVVDLHRGTWSFRARVAHTFSVVDTRLLTRARSRLDVAALGTTLGWLATALAAGRGLDALYAAGAESWPARWAIGVVLVYAAIAALYGALAVGYHGAGWDTPPLHVAPILARSVQEFWGERWARPISQWLGEVCFRPLRRTRPRTGVLAAFAVSAAFHAYAVWVSFGFVGGRALTAATFAYFVLQGAVMTVERVARVRRWPAWGGHAWTVVWMLALAPLFVEPCLRVLGFPAPRAFERGPRPLRATLASMAWVKIPAENHPLFRAALPKDPRVETMSMFGGIAARVNGNIFAGLFGRSTMIWLPEEQRAEALALEGAAPFDPMGRGARSDKVMLPEAMMDEPEELRHWLARAFAAAAALPRKAEKTPTAKRKTARRA